MTLSDNERLTNVSQRPSWNEGTVSGFSIQAPRVDHTHCYVYVAWGSDPSQPLYVGKSLWPIVRIGQHLGRASWASQVERFDFYAFASERDALRAESLAINELDPRYNVVRGSSGKQEGVPQMDAAEGPIPSYGLPTRVGLRSGHLGITARDHRSRSAKEGSRMNLEEHRHAYRQDLLIPRLVSRQPPTALDVNTGVLDEEPAARIGMSMGGRLLRYLGHPEGYGQDFPWSRAWFELRYWCRRNHGSHRRSDRRYWRGSLCHQIVRLTVISGYTPEQAAQILRLDSPEPVLSQALRHISETMDNYRARAEKRAREDEGNFAVHDAPQSHEHRALGGLHSAECPQCRRRGAA